MPDLATNLLYYGDNLDILRRYLPHATVDNQGVKVKEEDRCRFT